MRQSAWPGCALFVLVLVSHLLARAQAAPQDSVRVELCDVDFDAAVRSVLEVELLEIDSSTRAMLESGRLHTVLRCQPDLVTIRVEDREAARLVVELIDGAEPALPRRVALTLSEIYAALAATASFEPSTAMAEPSAALANPVIEPVVSAAPVEIRALGGLWLGGEPFFLLGSVELGAAIRFADYARLMLGLGGAFGSVSVLSGTLDVRVLSGALSLRFGGALGALELALGPALRGGVVAWTGHPNNPMVAVGRDTLGPWLGVGGAAEALVRLEGTPIRLGVDIEGGVVVMSHGATVLGTLAARLGSGWLDLRFVIAIEIV